MWLPFSIYQVVYWYLIFTARKAVNVDQALAKMLLADGCSFLPPHYIVDSEIVSLQQYVFLLSDFFSVK